MESIVIYPIRVKDMTPGESCLNRVNAIPGKELNSDVAKTQNRMLSKSQKPL